MPSRSGLAMLWPVALLMASSALARVEASPPQSGAAAAQEPVREIRNLRGDLYQVQVGRQFTVFLVTPDGIILGDPLGLSAAKWLKEELDGRFPDRPVRYVLETHHHFDRVAGASVFTATAEIVGHREFNTQLAVRRRSSTSYSEVTPVETSYDGQRSIELGGRIVEMVFTGPGHSADMSALYFPSERALFVVDHPEVTATLSFEFFAPQEVLAWLHSIDPLEIDLFISGARGSISAPDLKTMRRYVQELVSGVRSDFEEGMSLAQIRAGSLLNAYRRGPQFVARDAQIGEVYRGLRLFSATTSVSALTSYVSRSGAEYCARTTTCLPIGGRTSALNFAVGAHINALGLVAELRIGRQLYASRTSPLYDDEFAYRETMLSTLFRYRVVTGKPVSVGLLGGPALVIGDVQGLDRVKEGLAPFAGRHPFAHRTSSAGWSGGVDVDIRTGRRFSVHVPVRLTHVGRELSEWAPGSFEFYTGIGIGFRVGQRIHAATGRTPPIVTSR
jgi:hypothetical protein